MTVNWAVLQDPVMVVRLIFQLFLFAGSALFSMSETALFSLREADLQKLEQQRHPQAQRLRNLLDEPRQLIVSILCGNELINIAATINLAGILLAMLDSPQAAALVNTALMLPLLLIFCEITPKTVAVTQPLKMSQSLIEPAMTVWVRLVMPLRMIVRSAADMVTSLFVGQARDQQNILSTDEFRTLLGDVEEEGVVNQAERRIILNLIEAGSTEITQIMVPRPRIAFIDADQSVADIIDQFRRLRHRRLPVYRSRRDNVLGVIKEERLMEITAATPIAEIALDDLLEPAKLAPTTQTVGELAEFFKEGDHHAALVVNEFGGVEGLVTADDVFGFLTMGESVHLDPHAEIVRTEDGIVHCVGLTPIRSLRRQTGLPLHEQVGVSTVGGLIMTLLNRVPEPGDDVSDQGVVFRVLSMEGLLTDKVLIAPKDHEILKSPAVNIAQEIEAAS